MMKNNSPRVLIVAGGGIKHMARFSESAKNMGIDTLIASSSSLEYDTSQKPFKLTIKGQDVKEFNIVYIRVVGKRSEDMSLLVNYCRDNNIPVFDEMFQRTDLIRLPITKSVEAKLLSEADINLPRTYFGRLSNIKKKAPGLFGFPFVIKGTTGKQGNAVWSPRSEEELENIYQKLIKKDLKGERFLAQEFLQASQRIRAFVIGDKVIEAITRPTRWRRRFLEKQNGEFPEGKREKINISKEDAELAVNACRALGINVAGVDILKEDKTGVSYILEVNSAPRWEAVRKDTGLDVEGEILKWIVSKAQLA